MYTRKVRSITSTLALNIVFLDTAVTLTYRTFYIMHVNAVLFGSLIYIYTVIIYVYVHICWGVKPAGWTLGPGSCIYHMELGPGAGLPRAEIWAQTVV